MQMHAGMQQRSKRAASSPPSAIKTAKLIADLSQVEDAALRARAAISVAYLSKTEGNRPLLRKQGQYPKPAVLLLLVHPAHV